MTAVFMRYATPLITTLFLVSLISGIALFFHVGPAGFHGMHEWLSMVLIAPFALHLWKNWRPMTVYFKKAAFAVSVIASIGAASLFLVPTSDASGEATGRAAVFGALNLMMQGSVTEVAALLDMSPDALSAALKNKGLEVTSADQTLAEIGTAGGRDTMAMAGVVASIER